MRIDLRWGEGDVVITVGEGMDGGGGGDVGAGWRRGGGGLRNIGDGTEVGREGKFKKMNMREFIERDNLLKRKNKRIPI